MKYIVYQYLCKTTTGGAWLPYYLLILKENRCFGARFIWDTRRRLKKKLTEKIVQEIYIDCIRSGAVFDRFDYTETPDNWGNDLKELFSLNNRKDRIHKLKGLDELWDEKKLIYYQEV